MFMYDASMVNLKCQKFGIGIFPQCGALNDRKNTWEIWDWRKEHTILESAMEKVFTEGEVTVEGTLVTKSGKKIPHIYSAVRTMMEDKPSDSEGKRI